MEQFSIYYDNSCIASYFRDDEAKEYSYYVGYPSVYNGIRSILLCIISSQEKAPGVIPKKDLMRRTMKVKKLRKE